MLVESAILALVDSPGDEKLRQKARDVVQTLSSGCPECGFKESPETVRKLTSLLAVPAASANLQRSIVDRMIEQVGLLKAHAALTTDR